jgi:hypothetical protein
MIAYLLCLALTGLCLLRQLQAWKRQDDEAAVEAILDQWAAAERAKHPRNPRTGRFRKEYARHTIFPT